MPRLATVEFKPLTIGCIAAEGGVEQASLAHEALG